jgi:hypothetical protein
MTICYIKPRKRICEDEITLYRGTAYGYPDRVIHYDGDNYVVLEHDGRLLFDSRYFLSTEKADDPRRARRH